MRRFPDHERRLLLSTPGLGVRVVERLELAGFVSLRAIASAGVEHVTSVLCEQVGSPSVANRRSALRRAVARVDELPR